MCLAVFAGCKWLTFLLQAPGNSKRWFSGQQQEASSTGSSQQENSEPFCKGKPCGATYQLALSRRGVRTERPDVSCTGSGSQWSSPEPQWGCSHFMRNAVLSQVADTGQTQRPLCQSTVLSGTLLHADG